MTNDNRGDVIFRRFRRGRDGQIYDAHDYGVKAWPIKPRRRRPPKK